MSGTAELSSGWRECRRVQQQQRVGSGERVDGAVAEIGVERAAHQDPAAG